MILQTLEVGPILSNCYIVGSEKNNQGIIIDPGDEAEVILNAARKLRLSIVLIVATHTHTDHIAALPQVMTMTGAKFAVHELEATGELRRSLQRLSGNSADVSLQSRPKPYWLLHDGDKIEFGDLSFTVLHTPGHTPGGISIFGHGVVFCGDTLFNLSIGRTDLYGSSEAQLMKSIFTKLMVLPDETKVLPGHGPETTIGFERRRNPFLRGWK
jgi:glyoxylase-like metal-dependent hydrolase (beta-lactamase superfamily II)